MDNHDIIQENEELKKQLEGLQYMHEVYKELIQMNEERLKVKDVKKFSDEQSDKNKNEDEQRTQKQLSDFYIKMSSQFANVEQDLLEQFSMIKEVLNQLTEQRDMYENKIHSLTDTCEKLEGIQSTLVDQLESIELKKKDYEKRLVEMEKESESLQADNENLRGKIDQLLSIIANQQDNVLQLQENKKVVADKIKNEEQGSINEQIKTLLEKINNMEHKISKLKQEDIQAHSNEKDEQELFESARTQTNQPQTISDVSVPVQEQSPIMEVNHTSNLIKEKNGRQSDSTTTSTTTNSFIKLSEILRNSPETIVLTQKDQVESSQQRTSHQKNVVPKYKMPSLKNTNYVDPLTRLRKQSNETNQSVNQQKKKHKNEKAVINPKKLKMKGKEQHNNDMTHKIENVVVEEKISKEQSTKMTPSEAEQLSTYGHVSEDIAQNGVTQHTVSEKLETNNLIHQQYSEQNVKEEALEIEASKDMLSTQDHDDFQLNSATDSDVQHTNAELHLEHKNNTIVDIENLQEEESSIDEQQVSTNEIDMEQQHANTTSHLEQKNNEIIDIENLQVEEVSIDEQQVFSNEIDMEKEQHVNTALHLEQKASSEKLKEEMTSNSVVENERGKKQQTIIELNVESDENYNANDEVMDQKNQGDLDEQQLENVDNVEHTTHMNTSTVGSQHAQESDESTGQVENTAGTTMHHTIYTSKEQFKDHVDEIDQIETSLSNKGLVTRSEDNLLNHYSTDNPNNSSQEKQNKKSWFVSFLKKIKIYNK
ncbi:hypothetical protein [Bacillus sp. SM2101]|uniref:hypothetical protein n=1 Tax=Bacillus sp. SM2101 TaxID=2805366 RepID=UPI001BDE64D0|nr:hypothetical protein [Bacillus sp. SM2101]